MRGVRAIDFVTLLVLDCPLCELLLLSSPKQESRVQKQEESSYFHRLKAAIGVHPACYRAIHITDLQKPGYW